MSCEHNNCQIKFCPNCGIDLSLQANTFCELIRSFIDKNCNNEDDYFNFFDEPKNIFNMYESIKIAQPFILIYIKTPKKINENTYNANIYTINNFKYIDAFDKFFDCANPLTIVNNELILQKLTKLNEWLYTCDAINLEKLRNLIERNIRFPNIENIERLSFDEYIKITNAIDSLSKIIKKNEKIQINKLKICIKQMVSTDINKI